MTNYPHLLMIVLSMAAAFIEALNHDWPKVGYWIGSTILLSSVLFMK